MSTIFLSRIVRRNIFSFLTRSKHLEFKFLKILVIQKTHLLLKLIFTATEFEQTSKFDRSPKELAYTLVWSKDMILYVHSKLSKKVFIIKFNFFLLKPDHL